MLRHPQTALRPLLAGLLLASAVPAGAGTGWVFQTTTDGSEPTPRHEAAYVEVGGKFYLMGGRGSRPVDEFDPVAETWTELGFPPLQMHHFQPVVLGDEVWAVCAFQGNYPNETPVPNVWIYEPATDQWQMGPSIPVARQRGSAGAVVHEGMIYIVGGNTMGHDGGYVPWLDRYDPVTDTWTALPDAPHARDHFTAAVVGNELVVAGGRQTEQPNPFLNTIGAVDVYDFSTGEWSSMPEPIPTERAGTMTVARGEHVIVIGGETASQAHAETEALDVGTGEWTSLPLLNDSRHSGGAVLWQDTVYVASGAGNNGGGPELDTQEKLALTGLLGPSPSNLAENGDFDDGLTGWSDQGDLTLVPEGNVAAPSLEVANGWAGNLASVVGLETYTLSGVHHATGSSGDATIAMEFLDVDSVVIGEVPFPVTNTPGFRSFSFSGTTPQGTRFLRARVEATGDRTLRVDDVVVMEKLAEIPRLGSPANPWALQPSTDGPVAGLDLDPFIDHADFLPDATLDLLGIGFAPINFPGSLGTVLIDLVSPVILTAAPGDPFVLTIPFDPMLVGIVFHVQGASVAPSETRLTNALEVTIQAP